MINLYFKFYISLCLLFLFIGIYFSIKKIHDLEIFTKKYYIFLFKPWKFITFLIAFISFNIIAPFSGDLTWDFYTSSMMSIFTYLSAPWSVGIFYKFIKNKTSIKIFFIAIVMLFFSASWCYDWYLVIKYGTYPDTWFSNIYLSSIVYIAAGIYWNIEYREKKLITIAFLYDDWLHSNITNYSFKKIWWAILIITTPVAVLFLSFLFTIGVFSKYFF